jgi:hypothetical protein
MVQLNESLLDLLDARARRTGVSRSQVIREAVEAYLREEARERIARAYQEGYRRVPAGTLDEWGDLEALHEELARARAESGGHQNGSEWA